MSKGKILTPLIIIGLDQDKKLAVNWVPESKTDCMYIIADAIKIISSHIPQEKSPIIVPEKKVVAHG